MPRRGGVDAKPTNRGDGGRPGRGGRDDRPQRGGRGGRSGRGGRGGRGAGKPKTKEELDADLDSYFLKDDKTAAQVVMGNGPRSVQALGGRYGALGGDCFPVVLDGPAGACNSSGLGVIMCWTVGSSLDVRGGEKLSFSGHAIVLHCSG